MIEAIAELFVERVPRANSRPTLLPASSVLVVDACGRPRRVAELTRLVESSAPLRASYVSLGLVDEIPQTARFDLVWLFVDTESDLGYCGLFTRELGERFRGARVRLVGIGDVETSECALLLEESMVGAAPPWRRSRELARGAALLAEQMIT